MTDKAIRVLAFDGKDESWTMWEGKYKARAMAKGWWSIMKGDQTPPKSDKILDDTNASHKTEIVLRDKNNEGYGDILLSMEEEIAFGIVNEAKTDELPDGCL